MCLWHRFKNHYLKRSGIGTSDYSGTIRFNIRVTSYNLIISTNDLKVDVY